MKKLRSIGVVLFSICMLACIVPQEAYAASGKVTVSSASGNVGSKVTVTCKVSVSGTDIGAADITLSYDPSALEATGCGGGANATGGAVTYSGYASAEGSKSLSFTVTFRIRKEGSFPVTVSSAHVYDWDDHSVSITKGKGTVTGKAVTTPDPVEEDKPDKTEDTRDKNSKLSKLQVNPGTLSPAFSAGTLEYTVTVPETTKDVTISATAKSAKARVSISGGKDLNLGANTAKVIVTAENGTTTVYKLTIMCGEEKTITIQGNVYTIHNTIKDSKVPKDFFKGNMKYDGRSYEAVKHDKGEVYMFYLKGAKGSQFFLYDRASEAFYPYTRVEFANGNYIIPLPLDNKIAQFANHEQIVVELNDKQFNAWKLDDNFSVIYAMNQDGRNLLYQYDNVDRSLQRYLGNLNVSQPEEDPTVEKPKEDALTPVLAFVETYHLYIIGGLSGCVLLLLLMYICVVATRKENHQAGRRRAIRRRQKKNKQVEE